MPLQCPLRKTPDSRLSPQGQGLLSTSYLGHPGHWPPLFWRSPTQPTSRNSALGHGDRGDCEDMLGSTDPGLGDTGFPKALLISSALTLRNQPRADSGCRRGATGSSRTGRTD